jgi:ABC-type phosphate transport system permease subunit
MDSTSATSNNSSSTATSVSFFNVFSIVMPIVLVTLFLFLLSKTLKFFKTIGFKIRIVLKNAENVNIPLY